MKDSPTYVKIVKRSDEDPCHMESSPGLLHGGCDRDDEMEVFAELSHIVEEAIALYKTDGRALQPPTSSRDLANKLQNVA